MLNINSIRNNSNIITTEKKGTAEKTVESNVYANSSYGKYNVYFGQDLVRRPQKTVKFDIPDGYSLKQLVEMAQQDENVVGKGANSTVYNIPFLDDYVLKVLNKDDPNKIDMGEFPSNINLGQPVWQDESNPRILILKKIEGKEHSVPNWSRVIWNDSIYAPESVTNEQAKLYFSQISKLADMPQSAFDNLAADVKILSDKGYKLDSINPNNLIVDNEKEQIHVIDYFKVKSNERDTYRNCHMDLNALMLDFTLLPEYVDKLSPSEQKEFFSCAKTIRDKNYNAAKKAGLSTDENIFKKYIRTTSRWFTAHSIEKENGDGMYIRYYDVRLDDFINMLEKL